MKTRVRESSRSCYHKDIIGAKEARQSDAVAEFVLKNESVTRRMIAKGLRMETGTVAARVNKLKEPGGLLVESHDLEKCPISGKRVHWLRHRDNPSWQTLLAQETTQ